ncbi:uncharacterized protein MONOS_10669 [Monocercomonoides exilis]|uniref:uncharacterized protein n=1 Tax=Monocercomonoides exilis TaxID=2049356 RepID=UPI00355A708D|nr:hypothetical protein MONOS_10669 [Monocercomonoides exilis]|eukprot:MONOS_10669.1-p1 / transcript=MONOS_10669.1 / gene=MONOS_10669 / organism=Monocercomonoides_exilis_PA203 / gene_product=unspecified product / transcript_product=unspecified product / location=Mono_scaffold00493:29267-30219(-) / protein_length=230 / sequence_SO=supercontig / SO=protein_coding / is_pseudo=false
MDWSLSPNIVLSIFEAITATTAYYLLKYRSSEISRKLEGIHVLDIQIPLGDKIFSDSLRWDFSRNDQSIEEYVEATSEDFGLDGEKRVSLFASVLDEFFKVFIEGPAPSGTQDESEESINESYSPKPFISQASPEQFQMWAEMTLSTKLSLIEEARSHPSEKERLFRPPEDFGEYAFIWEDENASLKEPTFRFLGYVPSSASIYSQSLNFHEESSKNENSIENEAKKDSS